MMNIEILPAIGHGKDVIVNAIIRREVVQRVVLKIMQKASNAKAVGFIFYVTSGHCAQQAYTFKKVGSRKELRIVTRDVKSLAEFVKKTKNLYCSKHQKTMQFSLEISLQLERVNTNYFIQNCNIK